MSGASFKKPQGEFARSVPGNPHVHNTITTEADGAGVRSDVARENQKTRDKFEDRKEAWEAMRHR